MSGEEETVEKAAPVEEEPKKVEVEVPVEAEKEKEEAVPEAENVVTDAIPQVDLKPVLVIIVCALIGLGIGLWFSLDEDTDYSVANSWVALPGDLFLRSLRCIVLPLVFVNIILAVVDMINAGKASSVGWKTVLLYTLTTLLAAIEGLVFILMFKSQFGVQDVDDTPVEPDMQFKCNFLDQDNNQTFMAVTGNGTLVCSSAADTFELNDINSVFENNAGSSVANDISFSETMQDGIFRKLVPNNIVNEFVQGNFVGVLMFAIVFGVSSQSLSRQPEKIIKLLEEVNRVFLKLIHWIILFTPIAVGSLVAGNLGNRDDLAGMFADIGWLIAATILAMAVHFFVTYPTLFFIFVKQNPFAYYKYLIPAQTLAFASASSAATLPVSLDCVAASGQVPASVRNFVLSMGATLNMDGGGIYFPTAIVFLAVSDGLGDQLDGAAYFLILLLSTVGSAGTAPVPSASLVLIITAYNTVFDTTGTPESFGLILAVDWLMDRFRTTLNVTGDMTMARIVTAVAGVTAEDDVLFNEAVAGEEELVHSEASV
eukprot:augustus_masked-scaffold_2-processed-gene-24.45-mRNA-1 protein AED:0.04 eAED:0.04 QI:0/-1/0/1/-1/1/1/0/540